MNTGLARQFMRFCLVGGVGFAVDAGLLWLLLQTTALGPYLARIVSFLTAATVTWRLHRSFTFPAAAKHVPGGRQWAVFVAINAGGAIVNYGVYALLVATTSLFSARPVLAVAVGSAVALIVNFVANRQWVFRDARS